MKPSVLCPAGAEVHPVLSRNPTDVHCRVQGGLRPAAVREANGNPVLAVCCSDYVSCPVWRVHKDIVRASAPSTKRQRDETQSEPKPHALQGVSRESVVVS